MSQLYNKETSSVADAQTESSAVTTPQALNPEEVGDSMAVGVLSCSSPPNSLRVDPAGL